MPRKELAQEANHVNIGEKTYLVPVYRYFSSAHCTVVICLSPTDTNIIAWRHVPTVTFLFVGQHLWLQWQGREYLHKGNGWLLKTCQSDVKGISCQLLWLDASVLLFVCWKPAKYDGYAKPWLWAQEGRSTGTCCTFCTVKSGPIQRTRMPGKWGPRLDRLSQQES